MAKYDLPTEAELQDLLGRTVNLADRVRIGGLELGAALAGEMAEASAARGALLRFKGRGAGAAAAGAAQAEELFTARARALRAEAKATAAGRAEVIGKRLPPSLTEVAELDQLSARERAAREAALKAEAEAAAKASALREAARAEAASVKLRVTRAGKPVEGLTIVTRTGGSDAAQAKTDAKGGAVLRAAGVGSAEAGMATAAPGALRVAGFAGRAAPVLAELRDASGRVIRRIALPAGRTDEIAIELDPED